MRECDRALEAEAGWTASRRLADGDDLMSIADVQPVTWAIQVSLAALWQDWGIQPDVVVGHSMGEIAAATVAGALTVREAAAVICRRSELLATLSGRGAMWAVQLGEDAAREAVGTASDKVCVGVINSENSVVLAGEIGATNDVADKLREQGVACKRLPVDAASHAPLVEELRPMMLAGLRNLQPAPGQIPMFSTVTDGMIETSDLIASYWMDNLRSPVRFASAVRSLLAGSGPRDTLFLELSPHPTLLWAIEDMISSPGVRAACVPSLRPDTGEVESMLAREQVEPLADDHNWPRGRALGARAVEPFARHSKARIGSCRTATVRVGADGCAGANPCSGAGQCADAGGCGDAGG
jgi:acyl transferase domain-containing protein